MCKQFTVNGLPKTLNPKPYTLGYFLKRETAQAAPNAAPRSNEIAVLANSNATSIAPTITQPILGDNKRAPTNQVRQRQVLRWEVENKNVTLVTPGPTRRRRSRSGVQKLK